MNNPAYQKVTEHIMAQLEKGLIPWKNPINKNNMMPKNLITGTPYHGVNILSTHFYEVPYFMTFNQASAIEAKIMRGSKAVPIVYWNVNEYKTRNEDGAEEIKKGFILKYYNVFNVDSISDLPKKYCDLIQEEKRTAPNHKISTAEEIIKEFKGCPDINHETGGMKRATASYSPALDCVYIPSIGRFNSSEEYYSTLFHELTHSTGHTKRLGRFKEEGQSFNFGCKSYANEELTAELGASFLMVEIGSELQIENSAAYINSWLKALNNDKTLIVSASAKSEKAANYILNRAGE